jgi:hypothetical protein
MPDASLPDDQEASLPDDWQEASLPDDWRGADARRPARRPKEASLPDDRRVTVARGLASLATRFLEPTRRLIFQPP